MFCSSGFEPTLEPPQSSWPLLAEHVPLSVVLALPGDLVSSQLRLTGCLSADLQGGADLAPTVALVAGGQDQEPDCVVDALLGVSRVPQVVQRSLRSARGLRQVLDGSAHQPPGMAAGFGAHVNARCHWWGIPGACSATTTIATDNGANKSKHLHSFGTVVGAPAGTTFLISSHISPHGAQPGVCDNQRRSPAAAATARGLDGSGVC